MPAGRMGVSMALFHPQRFLRQTGLGRWVVLALILIFIFIVVSLLPQANNNEPSSLPSSSLEVDAVKVPVPFIHEAPAKSISSGSDAVAKAKPLPPQPKRKPKSKPADKPVKLNVPKHRIVKDPKLADHLPLFRDIYTQEPWPEISRDVSVTPDQVTSTVHYVWCQTGEFRYEHYLGVLSALRLLHPLKLVFHFSQVPSIDRLWYHVWFWELKQSLAGLELSQLSGSHKTDCASNPASVALDLLAAKGGVYIAAGAVLTRFPRELTQQSFWVATAKAKDKSTPAVIFSRGGFSGGKRKEHMEHIQTALKAAAEGKEQERNTCSSVDKYNHEGGRSGSPCILLTNQVRPKDLVTSRTPFGELGRWLYYGKRRILEAKKSETSSIPRIGHVTWLARGSVAQSQKNFYFFNFLSVLSAIYVGGLHHVYVYGDYQPQGEWWDKLLKKENVSFVPIEAIGKVFQQPVSNPAHRSDVIRPHVLRAYGGVYMDTDVFWANRLPDDLMRYPTVACPDWPARGEWPAAFNIGVLMSQSDSPWLRQFLESMRTYWDDVWYYNAIMMPYRTYERDPESLYIDPHLQVICFYGNCHPAWHDDYIRDINDLSPTGDFDIREGRAYHFTVPKPVKELTSPDEIKKGGSDFADLGRLILTKSGWGSLIGQ